MATTSRTNPSSSLLKLTMIADMDEFETTSESSTSGRHRGRSRLWQAAQQLTDHPKNVSQRLPVRIPTQRLSEIIQGRVCTPAPMASSFTCTRLPEGHNGEISKRHNNKWKGQQPIHKEDLSELT
ncbi:unnamed protein product [Caenorhabditis brenneri]